MDVLFAVLGFILAILLSSLPGFHINNLLPLKLPEEFMFTYAGAYLVFSVVQAFLFAFLGPAEVSALPYILRIIRQDGIKRTFIVHSLSILLGLLLATFLYTNGMYSLAYTYIKPYLKYILLLVALILPIKSKKPLSYAVIFLVSGLLGLGSLSCVGNKAFLPLFGGMFALAYLWPLAKQNSSEREQGSKKEKTEEGNIKSLKWPKIIASAILGVALGFVATLLPSISSPSVVATVFLPLPLSGYSYVGLIGSTVASEYIYSLHSWNELKKARVGWVRAIKRVSLEGMTLLIISAALAFVLGFFVVERLPQGKEGIKWITLLYMAALSFVNAGFISLFVLAAAWLVGELAVIKKVEKTALLGSIILPTLLLLWHVFL